MKRFGSILSLSILGWLIGCSSQGDEVPEKGREVVPKGEQREVDLSGPRPLFVEVGRRAGIFFVHHNAARGKRRLPETMGSGVAFFDYDNDHYPDLFFLNGAPIGEDPPAHVTGELYRNLRDGRYEDVTAGSGLDESFFAMGVAVGDYQNDGWLDLAVTGVDRLRLYRNLGNGHFENVTEKLGLDCPGFGSGVAFLDYDRDGFLDLFVGRYVEWTPSSDIPCSPDGINQTYCTPEVYPGISNCLLRNLGGKRFVDVSRAAGLSKLVGKTLGLVVLDFNDDGWPDIAVANDTVGNFLLINRGDGTFGDEGVESGMAYSESGAARGAMGIDAGDLDRDGQVDIVIGNFSQEMAAYYRRIESSYFIDDAAQVGIGIPTLMTLAFGTLVEDFDGDGWLDILLVNGHIEPDIAKTRGNQTYQQPPQFFRNLGNGKFRGPEDGLNGPGDWQLVARGFAAGDYDQDGDVDFVVTQNGGPAFLLRNDHSGSNWLTLQFIGGPSNRVGFGLKVRIVIGETVMTRYLVSGRSYLSASEPVIHVGLGTHRFVDRLEIFWPSGNRQTVLAPPINQRLEIREKAGSDLHRGSLLTRSSSTR